MDEASPDISNIANVSITLNIKESNMIAHVQVAQTLTSQPKQHYAHTHADQKHPPQSQNFLHP